MPAPADHFGKAIHIDRIITVHYFEFTNSYAYSGESHDYWELVYVDKGEIYVEADGLCHCLTQGEVIFHKPNEFHSLSAAHQAAPNVVIISFETTSPAMVFFEHRIAPVPKEKSFYIANILYEAESVFSQQPGAPGKSAPSEPVFGSAQLMHANLEMFLIDLYRHQQNLTPEVQLQNTHVANATQSKLINEIIAYMNANLHRNLKFPDIEKEFYIGRSYLRVLFKKCTGYSVLYYFRNLKMQEAKRLIREKRHNFSEIAKMLGFDSVHYFSASFKKHFNMNPTEYVNSVKLREDFLKSQSDADAPVRAPAD